MASVPGNIAIVQSLIGTIVNRPSSPFTSGLVYEDEKNCGSGTWARGTLGAVEGSSTTVNDEYTFPGTVEARYADIQAGYDYGCFNSSSGKWDLAAGAFVGYNLGATHQDVLKFNPVTEEQGGLDSTTTGKFNQAFVDLYFSGATGPWTTDLQVRYEDTDFTFTNDQESVELEDTPLATKAATLSGSVSYGHALQNDWVLVPTGGFAITRTNASTPTFGDLSTLDMDAHTAQVAFLGATLAKTRVSEAGDSQIGRFFTATIYNDFSGERTADYRLFGDPEVVSTSTAGLGPFGELSAGLSYVKILDGQIGAARQFNASIRADARFSGTVKAVGLTAQVRLQF